MFAEASLVLVVLERFLRIVVTDSTERHTLPNLLEMATSRRRGLLRLPGSPEIIRTRVSSIRNTLLHGNYEQAMERAGCSTVAEYFKTAFAREIEEIYQFTDMLMRQIDPDSGEPYAPR